MPNRYTGARTPGLAAILEAPGGPTHRQVEEWVRRGFLRPSKDVTAEPAPEGQGRTAAVCWPPAEQRVAIAMGRLYAAGLRPEAAEKVARHPMWGPVVLGPGVVVSLFELRPEQAEAVAS